jgi:cell wall-associated NlpC family hydrolase
MLSQRFSTGGRFGGLRVAVILLAALLAAACAPFQAETLPSPSGGGVSQAGARIVSTAMAQVGVQYRYGGSSPGQGFDCSGLVAYVYGQQGIRVPRTAAQQFAAATVIRERDLQPGDLVFFRLAGPKAEVSHVGIYAGAGMFVHAPQSGKRVGEASLDDDYYRPRLAGFGRFPSAGDTPHTAAQ